VSAPSTESAIAREGHEDQFRATWRLADEVANDPWYQAGYEYAATHKLTPQEMAALGPVLVRRTHIDGSGRVL